MSQSSLPDFLEFHGNGGSFPPYGTITASDHGPAVVVATWIMVCLMGLAVIARFGTRHNLDKDCVAIGVSGVCVSVSLLVSALPQRFDVWKLIRSLSLGYSSVPKHYSPSSRQLRTRKT